MTLTFHKVSLALFAFQIFSASAVQAVISVSSGNESGMSGDTNAWEPTPPPPPNPEALSSRDGYARLKTPQITELRRLDTTRVKIKWACDQPGSLPGGTSNIKVIILKQMSDGEWQRAGIQDWAPQGELIDNAAIASIWRWSAITTFTGTNSVEHLLDAGSDAANPSELEYAACFYGMLGYRGSLPQYSWAPPGHDASGSKFDWFRTVALSFNGQSPSFIPVNPPVPAGQDAPPTFLREGNGWFTEPEPLGHYTELSTLGYVIRQQKFTIQADALISGDYQGCLLGLTALPYLVQPQSRGSTGSGAARKTQYELRPTQVEVLGTRFEGLAENGFDSVTYFASQHLRGGVSVAIGTRRPKLWIEGVGTAPVLSKTGPITLSNKTPVADGIEFDLKANANALDETGEVLESVTSRKVKAITLPTQNWTVGMYPVDVLDAQTNIPHHGPNPPDAGALESALNDIFGKQANVTFTVILKPRLDLNTMTFNPPFPNYPPTVGQMKSALWEASAKEQLVLFWVDQMEPGTLGQAFGIPSRGAVIGPGCSVTCVAHEIGHCFGLSHCWVHQSDSGLGIIADIESKRVMGYAGGKLLRSKEIIKANQWVPPAKPLGPN